MTWIQSWWESMNEAERLLMLTFFPTSLVGTVAAAWAIPRLYGRLMGFKGTSRITLVSSESESTIVEVSDIPQPTGREREYLQQLTHRLGVRSRRRLLLEAAVLALAFLIVVTIGETSPSLHFRSVEPIVGFFLFWIVGTWVLRCVLFARRPRVVQTTWSPMILLVAFAFAMGLGAAVAIRDQTLAEKIQVAVLSFALVGGVALLSLYFVLGTHALFQRWLSADTSTHVVHWIMAAIAYSFIWQIFQPNLWWLGGLWLAGVPVLVGVSRLRPLPAVTLVFLRNFSAGRLSVNLFRFVSELWLESGPIRLIVGPDVIARVPDPSIALALITFRLRRRSVARTLDVDRIVAESSIDAGRDGRYRTRQFLCVDETWATMVSELMRPADAVIVMDLRGFSKANLGCATEFGLIPEAALLEGRLIILVDDTTDVAHLTNLASQRGFRADRKLRVFRVDKVDRDSAAALVGFAFGCANSTQQAF